MEALGQSGPRVSGLRGYSSHTRHTGTWVILRRPVGDSGMPGSTGDTQAPPAVQRKASKRALAAGQQQQQQQQQQRRPSSSQQGEASLPSSLLGQHHGDGASADSRRGGARPRGASRPPVKRARKEAQQQQGLKAKGAEGSPAVSNGTGTVKGSGAKAGPGPLPVDSGGGRPAADGPDATQKKPRRQLELWSAEDKTVFFQSLFEHGKDFEAIQNDFAKYYLKKGHPAGAVKNKEQVRYFYYHTWHSISKYIDFENVFCRGMEKSSQELYGLICYGELHKKIGRCVNDRNSVKLNELIQFGVTTLRHSGRKLRIKAPMCRALKKICDPYGTSGGREQKRIKLPTKVCVELQPRTNRAWTRVQSVAHNPRLRMMVELHRKVSHLIEFLKEKWTPKETRVRMSLLQQQQQQQQEQNLQQQQQSGEAEAPSTSSTVTSTSTATESSTTMMFSMTSSPSTLTSPSTTTSLPSVVTSSSATAMSASSTVTPSSSTAAASLPSTDTSSPSTAMSLPETEISSPSAATSSSSTETSSSSTATSLSSMAMSLPSAATSLPFAVTSSVEVSAPSTVMSSPSSWASSAAAESSSSSNDLSSSSTAPSTARSSSSAARSLSLTTRSLSLTTRSSSLTTRSSASSTRSSSSTARPSSSLKSPVAAAAPAAAESALPDERPQLRLFPPSGAVVSPLPCAARVRHSRTMCTVHWQEQSRARGPYVPPQAQLMRARPQLLGTLVPPAATAAVVAPAAVAKEGPVPGPTGTTGKGLRGSRAGASGQEVACVQEVAMAVEEVAKAESASPGVEEEVSTATEMAPVEPSSSPALPEMETEGCEEDLTDGHAAPTDSVDFKPDVSSEEQELELKLEGCTSSALVLSPVTNYEEYSLMDPVPRYLKSCRSLAIPSDEDERGTPSEPSSGWPPDDERSARNGADAALAPAPFATAAILNGPEDSPPGIANGSAENGADSAGGGRSPKPASPTEATARVADVAAQTGEQAADNDDGKKDRATPAMASERKQPSEPRGGGGKRGAEAARASCAPRPCDEDPAAFAERVWREGWGGSKTLTLAEVYVTLGKPEKLLLEYDWIAPPAPAAKAAPADEDRAPAAAAAAGGDGADPGDAAKTEAAAADAAAETATETGATTEAAGVSERQPAVHVQRMLKRLLQLVVLEVNPKVQRVQSPDGLNSSPSKASGAEAGGGGGTGGTGSNTRSPGSARAHPGRGARGSGGGGGGARNAAKPAAAAAAAAAAASGTEPDAAKTAGCSDDDLFRVPSALPPASRHGRPMSPSKEAEMTFRQQLDSINAEVFLPQHRKLRTRMLRKPLVVQRSLVPRQTGHSMRHMYSLAIVPSSSVTGKGMFSPLLPPAHPSNNPKASSLSTAIDLAAKSAGIIPGNPIREGQNEVTEASLSSAALPCRGGEDAGRYGAQSAGSELPGGLQDTGSGGSRRVPFITLSTPTEGHSMTSSGPCMDFVDGNGTLAMVGPPPVPRVEQAQLPSPPHVPLLLEISLPGPPDDSLSQGGPHSHIGDSIIELAIGSQRYMPGEGKLNGVDGDKPLPSPRNWMGSPPHESQWFGSDVGDVCLGSLLSNFNSPDKSQRTMQLMSHCTVTPDLVAPTLLENVHDSYAPRPLVAEADSPLASIICESGVDYIARFSDLAKEVSNSEPFTPMHSDPGFERRDAPTGLPAQSTPR